MRCGEARGTIAAHCMLVVGVVTVVPHVTASELEKFSNENVVKIENGLNFVDLDGDGDRDLVVSSRWRGGATGRHSDTYSFFVQVDRGGVTEWHEVSLNEFGAYGDYQCFSSDARVVLHPNDPARLATLIDAIREPGESVYDSTKVKFSFYELTNIDYMDIPYPIYRFELRDAIFSDGIYCDVGKAFKKELGID